MLAGIDERVELGGCFGAVADGMELAAPGALGAVDVAVELEGFRPPAVRAWARQRCKVARLGPRTRAASAAIKLFCPQILEALKNEL